MKMCAVGLFFWVLSLFLFLPSKFLFFFLNHEKRVKTRLNSLSLVVHKDQLSMIGKCRYCWSLHFIGGLYIYVYICICICICMYIVAQSLSMKYLVCNIVMWDPEGLLCLLKQNRKQVKRMILIVVKSVKEYTLESKSKYFSSFQLNKNQSLSFLPNKHTVLCWPYTCVAQTKGPQPHGRALAFWRVDGWSHSTWTNRFFLFLFPLLNKHHRSYSRYPIDTCIFLNIIYV